MQTQFSDNAQKRLDEKLIRKHRRDLHAVTIQSCVRMFLARLLLIEKQREAAYVKLNRAFSVIKGFQIKCAAHRFLVQLEKVRAENAMTAAAIEIQCAARRFISMHKLLRLKKQREELIAKSIRDELNSNAKKLQCLVRRHIAIKVLKMMKKQKMHHKLAMNLIVEKHVRRQSSIKIQALVRQNSAKKIVEKRRKEHLSENATIIQKYYRRFSCLRAYKSMRNSMATTNVAMMLEFAQDIVDVVHRTEDIVSKIEGDLLGIDVASVHPDGKQVQLWETLEKMLFQTRLKAMTEKISKTGE